VVVAPKGNVTDGYQFVGHLLTSESRVPPVDSVSHGNDVGAMRHSPSSPESLGAFSRHWFDVVAEEESPCSAGARKARHCLASEISGPAELMDKFVRAMDSIASLISFTSFIIPVARLYRLEGGIFDYATKNLTAFEKGEDFQSFSYTIDQWPGLHKTIREYLDLTQGALALPKAILLSLVATFDSYFAEIVQLFLAIHPERYTASDRQISLKEIFTKQSLEEVVRQVIENEVSDLMRSSHTEQAQFVESNLNVKIISHYQRWSHFVEIFGRRNLVAHGNLIVNDTYRNKCKEAKVSTIEEIGVALELNQEYLNNAVEVLTEFGVLLIFTLWKKHFVKSDEYAFKHISKTCYNFIVAEQFNLAKNLLEFCLYKQKRSCSDGIIRMMLINLANCYKKLGLESECKKALSSMDWSASKDQYQICIASLRNHVERVIELMPIVATAKTISAREFREWPVLDWVRDDPAVIEAFERIYGEPIRRVNAPSITGEISTIAEDSKATTAEGGSPGG